MNNFPVSLSPQSSDVLAPTSAAKDDTVALDRAWTAWICSTEPIYVKIGGAATSADMMVPALVPVLLAVPAGAVVSTLAVSTTAAVSVVEMKFSAAG